MPAWPTCWSAAKPSSASLISSGKCVAVNSLRTMLRMVGESSTMSARLGSRTRIDRLIRRSIRVRLPSRALIVDDSPTMRSIVRKLLTATHFPLEISEADEGFAALQQVGQAGIDLVFLDYNMPGFSGLETLAEFKREKRHMTVVVMSSAQDATLAERVHAQRAAFLKKPFFPADIEAVLTGHYGLT